MSVWYNPKKNELKILETWYWDKKTTNAMHLAYKFLYVYIGEFE